MARKTLIVIPAYNEGGNIAQVVRRAAPFGDVLVVDDGSTDETPAILRGMQEARCIRHPENRHIRESLMDGFSYALRHGYDYTVTMDAGLSHLPEEIPRFLCAPPCDLVLGVRGRKTNAPGYRRRMSMLAAAMLGLALGRELSDATSGFRRYSQRSVALLMETRPRARMFAFHMEALVRICKAGLTLTEVPITYDFTGSSFNGKVVLDALRVLPALLTPGAGD